jgi:flagellar motor switch protein FliM
MDTFDETPTPDQPAPMAGDQPEANPATRSLPGEAPLPGVQGQVEKLVTAVQAEEAATTVLRQGGRVGRLKREDVQQWDFRRPSILTGGEMRKLRLRHEEFIRSLAAHLSTYLRLEVGIKLTAFETLSYREFAARLPGPTHLSLFKLEPLDGVGVLDLPLRLGLTLVDRLLGGPAQGVVPNGELSEIEVALLDQTTTLIIGEWCQLWQKVEALRPSVAGHESSGRFLNGAAPDSVMLVLSAEMQLGDCTEVFQLALPFAALEPFVRKIARAGALPAGAAPSKAAPLWWNPGLNEVPIRVRTQWNGLELSARALSRLKAGDVLRLEGEDFSRVEVLFEQTPKFRARLGTAGDHWAAELTETLTH